MRFRFDKGNFFLGSAVGMLVLIVLMLIPKVSDVLINMVVAIRNKFKKK